MKYKINYPAILVAAIMVVTGLLVLLLPHHCSIKRQLNTVTAERDSLAIIAVLEPTIDTHYSDTTIYVVMPPVVVTDSVYDTLFIETCKYLRSYRDSVRTDEVTLYWDLQTRGSLIGIDMWYDLHVPLVITKTIPVHTTTVVKPKTFSFHAEAHYLHNDMTTGLLVGWRAYYKRIGIGYSYGPGIKTHLAGVSYRIE